MDNFDTYTEIQLTVALVSFFCNLWRCASLKQLFCFFKEQKGAGNKPHAVACLKICP